MSAVPPESPRASADQAEQVSDRSDGKKHPASASTDFGPNEWLVDELYQRYLADPGSVDMAWWNFFADYQPPSGGPAHPEGTDGATLLTHPAPPPAAPPAPPAAARARRQKTRASGARKREKST